MKKTLYYIPEKWYTKFQIPVFPLPSDGAENSLSTFLNHCCALNLYCPVEFPVVTEMFRICLTVQEGRPELLAAN